MQTVEQFISIDLNSTELQKEIGRDYKRIKELFCLSQYRLLRYSDNQLFPPQWENTDKLWATNSSVGGVSSSKLRRHDWNPRP